jgi:hypothetical protein
MRTFQWLALTSTVALVSSGIMACSRPAPPAAPTPVIPAQVPTGTVRDVMKNIVDESSQAIFDSVAITVGVSGTVQKQPTTQEDWDKLERWAFRLAEAPNLLKVPGRRVARPDEEKTSAGPTELTPIEIQAKIEANPQLFYSHVDELQKVSMEALTAVRSHNVQALFDVSGKIDAACESCHLEFWYPAEKKPS